MSKTVLIIGGNKGIGLALAAEYASTPNTKVIATARTSTDDLDKISAEHPGVLTVLKLDVTDRESLSQFGKELKQVAKEGIDIFIGNSGAGTGLWSKVLDTSYEDYMFIYQLNVLGLIFSFKEAHDLLLLKPTKQSIFMSSEAGLVSAPTPFPTSSYGASKAALNHICISLGSELKEEGIAVAAVHPGNVDTEAFEVFFRSKASDEIMGQIPLQSTAQSADSIVNKIIPQVTLENTGKYFDISGEIVPL